MKLAVPVAVVILAVASSASAQICSGNPSFRNGPYQVGITAAVTDGAQGVGGTFAGGGESLFAGVGLSVLNYSGIDARSTTVSGFGGAEFATDDRNTVLFCPVAELSFGVGPDIGAVDISTLGLQAGVNVGVVASDAGGLMVVPTFGLAAVVQRVSADFGALETSDTDTGGVANVGVGLIFNRNVAVTPRLLIPFSTGSNDVIFTVTLSFNFGA
jgi:hypothetical protein